MAETVALLAPFDDAEAIDLGNNYWRKQVLRHGDFRYKDRTLKFTPEYTAKLAAAYRAKAYDAVPFQFAGSDNAHTNAIEATRGEIVGFEPTADGTGLDAIFSLEPEAQQVVARHPKLPVSVRIIENLERADGEQFDAAIQHVLATWDPRVTAMKPWERVELSNDGIDHVYDLTDATPQEGTTMPTLADQFTDEEIKKLRALLSADDGKTPDAKDVSKDGKDVSKDAAYVPPSDEELDRIARALFPDEVEDAPAEAPPAKAEIKATADDPKVVEMATRLSAVEAENTKLRKAAETRAYEQLRDDLARDSGIPPAITDLAKELLTGAHTIEMSNGETVDAGAIVHKVLTAIGEQVKMLDLSGPVVFDQSAQDAEATADKSRASFAADYARQHGLL
jgi:hypothetical protein